jgi:adenylyltransferase/sulfurtransferase
MCLDESLGISPSNTNMTSVIDSLRKQISTCETTLQDLRQQLADTERIQRQQEKVVPKKRPLVTDPTNPLDHDMNFGVPDDFRSEIFAVLEQEAKAPEQGVSQNSSRWPLEKNEYKRYGRQLIMPEIGLQGQYFFPGRYLGDVVELMRA